MIMYIYTMYVTCSHVELKKKSVVLCRYMLLCLKIYYYDVLYTHMCTSMYFSYFKASFTSCLQILLYQLLMKMALVFHKIDIEN
jgi:hypothetical protein